MWSVARYDLGLTSDEFFALTPRQYDALVKRRERETQEHEFLLGQLTAAVVNFSICHPKDTVAPADFMPSQFGKPKPAPSALKRTRITRKVQQELRDSFRAGFAGLMRNK